MLVLELYDQEHAWHYDAFFSQQSLLPWSLGWQIRNIPQSPPTLIRHSIFDSNCVRQTALISDSWMLFATWVIYINMGCVTKVRQRRETLSWLAAQFEAHFSAFARALWVWHMCSLWFEGPQKPCSPSVNEVSLCQYRTRWVPLSMLPAAVIAKLNKYEKEIKQPCFGLLVKIFLLIFVLLCII